MESLDEIKGYIIYKEEEIKEAKEGSVVETSEIVKKFQGKLVQDFVPHFLLAQHANDLNLDFESFDQCVDEYFSQAEKQREKSKVES